MKETNKEAGRSDFIEKREYRDQLDRNTNRDPWDKMNFRDKLDPRDWRDSKNASNVLIQGKNSCCFISGAGY